MLKNDPNIRRKRCRELWLELLDQYQASGLFKKDFAKNNDIKLDDLIRWCFRYKKKADRPKFSAIKIITPTIQNTCPINLKISDRYCIELSAAMKNKQSHNDTEALLKEQNDFLKKSLNAQQEQNKNLYPIHLKLRTLPRHCERSAAIQI